jgi:hypothetical protein
MALRPCFSAGLLFRILIVNIITSAYCLSTFTSVISTYKIAIPSYSFGTATTNKRPQLTFPSALMQVWKTTRRSPT